MEFNNVKVIKKATVYFDGKVTSRTIYLENGERKTLGFMTKGEYVFNTGVEELMEVIGGEMDVRLLDESEFITYKEGDSFIVPEKSTFEVKVKTYGDYCCSYRDK